MSIKIPYVRKKISPTLFTFSAIELLLLASPLVFSNHLFRPVQAQSNVDVSFGTAGPASTENDNCLNGPAAMTFDAKGTASSSAGDLNITSGTFSVNASGFSNGQPSYGGDITGGTFNTTGDGDLSLQGTVGHASALPFCNDIQGSEYQITTQCSASNTATVTIGTGFAYPNEVDYSGVVECSPSQGGDSTQPSSSMAGTTTTTKDSDGDGKPDSSDNCPHNSYHKCFKEEGDTSTTTTHDQQPSSSNGTGNQTR